MAMEIFKLMGTVAISKDKALKDIKDIQAQAEKASTAMGKSFTKFSGYVEKHSAQIKKAGKYLTVFGGIATAAFALSVKSAANFEEQLANVSTMLDESAMKILPEYRRELQSLSVEFGESTETLSKGLYDILSASIPPAEALGVLEVSAKAAAAGITDTGVAADAITTILNSYGLQASEAGRVSDLLFGIVKAGKTTFNELAPAIGKTAATAAMAGLSVEDLGASIATMTRAGIRTEETMTSINGVLIAFLKPTDDAIEAAAKFGLELNTNTLRTEGLTGVMDKLKDATAEQLATIFPNIRGLKGMAAALGDAEGYARDYALMLNSAGLTQEAFAKQSATLNFKLGQLKGMFNVIKVAIGTALMPAIEDITKKIMGVLTKVKEWTEANPKLTATMVKWAAGISGLMLVVGPLLIALPSLVSGINLLRGVIPGLVAALGKIKIALSGLGTIGAGPIGLFIIAVTALVLGLKKWQEHSEKVREENEKLKASLMGFEEINDRVEIVEERIKELRFQLEKIGESAILGGDLVRKEIKALEVELRALIGTGKVLSKINADTAESYREYYEAMAEAADYIAHTDFALEKMIKRMVDLETELKSMETELSTMVAGSKQWQLLSQSIEEVRQSILDLKQEMNEVQPTIGTIVTTVKDLTQEMSFLSKEYELTNKSVGESIEYYKQMIEKVNQVDVILQTELMLLKEGTEEWYKKKEGILDNLKVLKELTASLEEIIEPLEGLDLIAAKMALLGDSIAEIPAKLELLKEKAILLKTVLDEAIPDTKAWWEAKDAYEANQVAIEALAGSFDEYGEKGKALLTSLIELTDKQKELQEVIDVVGVDKQSEAYRYLKIEYNANESAIASLIVQINNLEREQREAEQAAKGLADAYKTITDKIYELTHTPMETAIRKLDQQKQEYIKLGMEIGIVNKWYDLQIAKLKELNPELDITTKKLEETGKVGAKAGEEIADSFTVVRSKIDLSTNALSNFTKEGIAAAIATIRMKFMPLIKQAVIDLNWAKTHFNRFWGYQQTHLDNLQRMMNQAIATVRYGYEEYQKILASMEEGGAGGTVGFEVGGVVRKLQERYQRGGGIDNVLIRATPGEYIIDKPMTDFIKRTGIVTGGLVKAIASGRPTPTPGMQRGGIVGAGILREIKYNIGPIYVAGDGDVGKIKSAIKQALDESNLQILRSGSEVIPGVD